MSRADRGGAEHGDPHHLSDGPMSEWIDRLKDPDMREQLIRIVVFVLIYFLPTFISGRHKNHTAIFVLNLLLGWTIIGWSVAMVWAFIDQGKRTRRNNPENPFAL